MKEFSLKICLFLFRAAVFSGRTNELGTLTGAITGTVFIWPLYRNVMSISNTRPRRKVLTEDPAEIVAGREAVESANGPSRLKRGDHSPQGELGRSLDEGAAAPGCVPVVKEKER